MSMNPNRRPNGSHSQSFYSFDSFDSGRGEAALGSMFWLVAFGHERSGFRREQVSTAANHGRFDTGFQSATDLQHVPLRRTQTSHAAVLSTLVRTVSQSP